MLLDLIVIARDEADRIDACLRSVPFARAWVLDAGSADGTPEIARAAGATVLDVDWPGFLAQRTRALGCGDRPFQLFLDADERLTDEAAAQIRAVIEDPGSARGWSFPRATTWAGRVLRHGRAWPDRQVRLIRRGSASWRGEIHERLVVQGPVIPLDGPIAHHPYRSLGDHFATIDRYSRLHADVLRGQGIHAGRLTPAVRGSWHLARALILEGGLLDGPHGVGFAAMGALHTALKWRRVRTGCR